MLKKIIQIIQIIIKKKQVIFCKRCGKYMYEHIGYSNERQRQGHSWDVYACADFNKGCDYLEGVPHKNNK